MHRIVLIAGLFFAAAAMLLLSASPVRATAGVSPSSIMVKRGETANVRIDYRFSSIDSPELSSPGGDFLVRGSSIGQFASPLSLRLSGGAGSVSETLVVPAATIEAAVRLNSDRMSFRRVFTSSSRAASVAVDLTILIDDQGPAGPLSLKRIELYFVDEQVRRNEITVQQHSGDLKVYADVELSGSGILAGYWEVDGRRLENLREYVSFGQTVRLSSSDIPGLTTFATGFHSVRLVVTDPAPRFELPEVVYFVVAGGGRGSVDIDLLRPPSGATLRPDTVFSWRGGEVGTVYILTILRRFDSKVVLRGLTRDLTYQIPHGLFAQRITPHNDYRWHVEAFEPGGQSLGTSPARQVRAP